MTLQCFHVLFIFFFMILLPLGVELRFLSWLSKENICARFSFNHFAEEEIKIRHLRQGLYVGVVVVVVVVVVVYSFLTAQHGPALGICYSRSMPLHAF